MESETEGQAQGAAVPVTAAAQMRSAREAAGLQLAEVAARTRVPLRHLEALERGDFAALPGITYCAGFTRAYARAVGLDEKALVSRVREEIDAAGDFSPADVYQIEEPTDPARVPPRSLAWVAAIVGLLMVSGYGLWRMQVNTPPGEEVAAQPTVAQVGATRLKPAPPPVLTGPVVLTAVEDVWLRIYDADGKSLLQKTLVKGESYTVPAEAHGPMILTGRPDALAVTVAGRPIPPLGTAERTISDVPISAEALLARGTVQVPAGNGEQPSGSSAQQPQAANVQAPVTRASTVQAQVIVRQNQSPRPQQPQRAAASVPEPRRAAPPPKVEVRSTSAAAAPDAPATGNAAGQ
ncbi:MAG TPA: RodZ domain-containing protein [Sphingobium sp.]